MACLRLKAEQVAFQLLICGPVVIQPEPVPLYRGDFFVADGWTRER